MPLINPDEIIKNNFKILNKRSKSPRHEHAKKSPEQANSQPQDQPLITTASPPTAPVVEARPNTTPPPPIEPVDEILVRKGSSDSLSFSTKQSPEESRSYSRGDDGYSSVYVLEEIPPKKPEKENKNDGNNQSASVKVPIVDKENNVDKDGNKNAASEKPADVESAGKQHKDKWGKKRKPSVQDRRRSTWIPCTCPQYKVSKELSTKWDLQGIFFGKILVVKVIQLMVINLLVFVAVFHSNKLLDLFKNSHDWAYLAYGVFLSMLICIRWGVGYRSKWPMTASFILMVPLTFLIAFVSACITTIYNSILIPMVTATIFLTFLMLTFTPYLLRKSVMHRSTNLAGCGLTFLSSVILIFLKEFEGGSISYWDFVSRIWLPGAVLSQIAVQITIFEIQRIIFGLCFNVSTKRWHIAAMYI